MEPTDQQNNQPQVIKPEDMFNPSVPRQTPAPNPNIQIPQPMQQPNLPPVDDGKRKRILIVAGGGALLLIVIIIIAVVLSSGGKKNDKTQTPQDTQSSSIIQEPSALDIENANNSISSDITGLDDGSDFPEANLSDQNLQL